MLRAVCVQTSLQPPGEAARALIEEADSQLGVYRPQAGMLFSSHPHEMTAVQGVLEALQQRYPGVQLIFCSITSGFTFPDGYLHDGYFLSLWVSDVLSIRTGMLSGVSELLEQERFISCFDASVQAQALPAPPSLCIAFPSYHKVDGVSVASGIQQVVGANCLVFGGCSADYWSEATVQGVSGEAFPIQRMLHGICQQGLIRIEEDAMPYLLVSGKFEYQLNYTCGWLDSGDRFGIEVDETTLTRIDDMDAFAFLRQMRHPLVTSNNFVEYPLWIHEPGKEPYQRDIFIDRETQRIHTGFMRIDPNAQVSFSFPDRETLLNEHRMVLRDLGEQYDLSMVIACSSRVLALKEEIGREATQLESVLHHSPVLGMYTFGEIFPHQGQGSVECQAAVMNSATFGILSLRAAGPLAGVGEADQTKQHFLHQLLTHKNERIAELEQQLEFFENNRSNQENVFLKDCLGLLLSMSNKSVSAFSELLEEIFQRHYQGDNANYPTSRGRLIARLNPLKKAAEKKFIDNKR